MLVVILLSLILGYLLIRISLCLPIFSARKVKKIPSGKSVSVMVVWGSGGHTTEMIMLLRKLSSVKYQPVHNILAESDRTSLEKISSSSLSLFQENDCHWYRIMRSREVKQSWLSTVFTTLLSCLQSLWITLSVKPDLILCNGPGTCVPICYGAFLWKLLGLSDTSIIFVESFCRVESLSITGKLLYPIADRFIVQWPSLAEKYSRAEYLGDFQPKE